MEVEKDGENSPVSNETVTANKDVNKEDLEERYNKLKGFAVKLKKKVNDLTEDLRVSEAEKLKVICEREEIQKKVSQISDNAKKLQKIQLEYDRLQDSLEEHKTENKKIIKNLETLVLENGSLKESLHEQKENSLQIATDLENRTRELNELKNILKKNQNLIKKLEDEKRAEVLIREQREKDYEEIKNKLEFEIQAHKITKGQLDTAKQERASNNVLFLEVDNYEKSIEDLKSKLSDESERCLSLESTIEEQRQSMNNLEIQLTELRDTCFAKTNQLTSLSDKNESLKSELCDLRKELSQMTKEKESLVDAIETIKLNSEKLAKESLIHAAERDKLIQDIENKEKNYAQQIELLKIEISRLNDVIKHSECEIDALKSEFEGYKLRAQSVLRNKKSQNKEIGFNGITISEIEEELNHLRSHTTQLSEKLDCCSAEIKSLTTDLNLVKEERDSARESVKDLGKKLSGLSQDYSTLRDQYRLQLSMIDKMRDEFEIKEENLKSHYETQISELEARHNDEIEKLNSELQKFSSKSTNGRPLDLKNDSDSILSRNDIHLLEREDGEGSESVDSYQLGNSSNEKQRRPSLVPLDELLNSSDDLLKSSGPVLPGKVDRQELEICERRVKHLTVLLADAERDVAKLNQMNQMLKEDIRRQQRSVEREHHANNFEYLKNVVLKFIILKNGDERSRLIPVLNTILKLSPEETHQLNQVAGDSPDGSPDTSRPVDESEEFCCVFQTRLTQHSLLFGAEMDGLCSDEKLQDPLPLEKLKFVELKTSRIPDNDRQVTTLERHKFFNWWCQSFLVGIQNILCGFRDDSGIVRYLENYDISEIARRSQRYWSAAAAMNFCDNFLKHIAQTVVDDCDRRLYKFERIPNGDIFMTELPPTSEFAFLPSWYIKLSC